MTRNVTFRDIEKAFSIIEQRKERSSLGDWYESVRDMPLSDFGVADLCKACRQQLYLDYVLEYAIQRLAEEPLAGDMYDGELVVALAGIPTGYWVGKKDTARLVRILHLVRGVADSDISGDIDNLLGNLHRAMHE